MLSTERALVELIRGLRTATLVCHPEITEPSSLAIHRLTWSLNYSNRLLISSGRVNRPYSQLTNELSISTMVTFDSVNGFIMMIKPLVESKV